MSKAPLPVIIMRAEPGASETAAWLEAEGYRPILSPAIILRLIDPAPALSLDGLQDLVFSSANGVRFFCEQEERRDFTAWCVGSATFDAAMRAGFPNRNMGVGNALELAEIIIENTRPDAGGFLHVGNKAAGDALVQRLQLAGFEANFVALYESLATKELSPDAQSLMESANRYVVLVHSARGAEAFTKLAAGYDFTNAILVAISDQAAAPLAKSCFGRTIIASDPSRDAMSKALKRVSAAL